MLHSSAFHPVTAPLDTSMLPSGAQMPEEKLMVAVLAEALMTFERGLKARTPIGRREFHDVDRWIRSHAADDLFAFESVCGFLALDADYVRSGLANLKRAVRHNREVTKSRKLRRERISDRRVWRGRIGSA
jgi:hypothetical protein